MPQIFPPSHGERRWRAASYVFCAALGFFVLLGDQSSLSSILGVMTLLWGAFMLAAIPAAVAVLWGRYRVESVLLPLFGSALIVSIVNIWIRTFMGNEDLFGRACVASALMCLIIVRAIQLRRIVRAKPWITTRP